MKRVFTIAIILLAGCKTDPTPKSTPDKTPVVESEAPKPTAEPSAAKLPSKPGDFSPAFSKLDGKYNQENHTEFQKCGECHAQIVEEWKDSVHALASMNNPYYRASFDGFSEAAGKDKTPFCGGCHDPALTFDHKIKQEIVPEDRNAHVGVTCMTCHGATAATTDGNGSYTMNSEIAYPIEGDDASLKKHIAQLGNSTVKSAELCVSCHKGFLSPETGHGAVIAGLNEFAPWRGSGYNKNPTTRIDAVEAQSCTDCHMPDSNGHKSHRFAGGHMTLAAAVSSDQQLEANRKLIKNAATIDVAAVGVGPFNDQDIGRIKANDKFWFDVVVFNKNTGHKYPGGALDLRDTWIEVEVRDANGRLVAEAGTQHAKTAADELAVRLKATVSSPDGEIVKTHEVNQFRTPIFDRTIGTRDARVSRYVWKPTKAPKQPLTIKATLNHRRLTKGLFEEGCALQKTELGKRFQATTTKVLGRTVDGCVPQPITQVSQSTRVLGGEVKPEKAEWLRHYHRGLGLLHQLQEAIDESKHAFEEAQNTLPKDAPDIDKARVLFGLGQVASRQGRVQDAMDFFAKAEKLVGEQPSIHYARGRAHQKTFRNEDAVKWYEKAAKLQSDDRIYRQLAIASGSIMKPEKALDAAQKGLEIEPRDPHLLRSQMLAIRKSEASDADKKAAKEAFLAFKRDEESAAVRDRCTDNSEACRRERLPIPEIELRTR